MLAALADESRPGRAETVRSLILQRLRRGKCSGAAIAMAVAAAAVGVAARPMPALATAGSCEFGSNSVSGGDTGMAVNSGSVGFYHEESDLDKDGNAGASGATYYFSAQDGQALGWGELQQTSSPFRYCGEGLELRGMTAVINAKGGGQCNCAPFNVQNTGKGTNDDEWYHKRTNARTRVSNHSDSLQDRFDNVCCYGPNDILNIGQTDVEEYFWDPVWIGVVAITSNDASGGAAGEYDAWQMDMGN